MPQPRLQTVFGFLGAGGGGEKSDRLTRFHRLFYGVATDATAKLALATTDEEAIEAFLRANDHEQFVEKTIHDQIGENSVGADVKKAAIALVLHQVNTPDAKISVPDAIRVATNTLLLESIGIHHDFETPKDVVDYAEAHDHEIEPKVTESIPHDNNLVPKTTQIIINQLRNAAGVEDGKRKDHKLYSSVSKVAVDSNMIFQVSELFKGGKYEHEAEAIASVADIGAFLLNRGSELTKAVEAKIYAMETNSKITKETKDKLVDYVITKLHNGTYESVEAAVAGATAFMEKTIDITALEAAVTHASTTIIGLGNQVTALSAELDSLRVKHPSPELDTQLANSAFKLSAAGAEITKVVNDTAAEANLLIHLLAVMTTTLEGVSNVGIKRDDEMKTKIDALIETLTKAEEGSKVSTTSD